MLNKAAGVTTWETATEQGENPSTDTDISNTTTFSKFRSVLVEEGLLVLVFQGLGLYFLFFGF